MWMCLCVPVLFFYQSYFSGVGVAGVVARPQEYNQPVSCCNSWLPSPTLYVMPEAMPAAMAQPNVWDVLVLDLASHGLPGESGRCHNTLPLGSSVNLQSAYAPLHTQPSYTPTLPPTTDVWPQTTRSPNPEIYPFHPYPHSPSCPQG